MGEKIKELIAKMTLEEKASLCSGLDFWHSKGIERLGIPSLTLTDGPHGLRKQATSGETIGLNQSVPATCFPTASATASSWDRGLMEEIGVALGEECQQEDVAVILGPGANIKRSPLCGRNFEYVSEDPFLTGEMTASLINGVQSQGVGTSLKHFAVNNQETRRMTINAVVDERALREIYLAGFERAVKKSQPWTVMCSYNRLNGTYTSEYGKLLTEILRRQWGFEGFVVTDWGACNDRVEGLKAGQDLEMPASQGINDARLVAAVRAGKLDEAVLDLAVERILTVLLRTVEARKPGFRYDQPAHHALARRAAANSMVLLRNENALLPLKKDAKIAVIGAFARHPRYQGAGSSLMNPVQLDMAYDEILKVSPDCTYAAGYDMKSDLPNETLIAEACKLAQEADVAVIFAGLPDVYETEGIDREHIHMPEAHNRLIEAVARVNPRTVVVLSNGTPVSMPWLERVQAVLEGFLGGEASGGAAADVLFGLVNPSGKLSETYPVRLEHNPSFHNFPAGPKTVEYRESIYVGYRYYEAAKREYLFPFGYGLSYTTFEIYDLELSSSKIKDSDELTATVWVKNSGSLAGAEVLQLYVRDVESTIFRPVKELKGFEKVFLQPGEAKQVSFTLDQRSFAYYNTEIADWHVESGAFEVLVGSSSRDIRARATLKVQSTRPDVHVPNLRNSVPVYYNLPEAELVIEDSAFRALYGKELPSNLRLPGEEYTLTTPLRDIRDNFVGKKFYDAVMSSIHKTLNTGDDENGKNMLEMMMNDMPLRNLVVMSNGMISADLVNALLLLMNGRPVRGVFQLLGALRKKK